MIIDIHGHSDIYELFNWIDPPDLVVRLMDLAGIDVTCVTTYGEAPAYDRAISNLVDFTAQYPDRLIGFVRVNPGAGKAALDAIEEAAKCPRIKGIKLHPVSNNLKAYNPFVIDVLKKGAELGMPVFFHCGDKVCAQPWQIGLGAIEVPECNVICHMGGFFHGEESIRMAKDCPNVYLDTSSGPYPRLIEKAVAELGADRVVFATDNPAGDPISDLKKVLNLGLDEETLEKILWKNAAKLLHLEEIRGQKVCL